jgi:trans-aconitate 2-methyltransferase
MITNVNNLLSSEYFMWNPADYAQNSEAQLKWAQQLRSQLKLKGDESILDVGCGDGKITADFAAKSVYGKVVGIDSSPEMIDYATQTYPKSQYPNLSFICTDARSLDFKQEFDLIFSNAVLHWVDDHQAFLHGAKLALRDGGRLIISCGGKGNSAGILQVFDEILASETWSQYFDDDFCHPHFFYSDREYRLWLQESGFAINRLELVPKDMTHNGSQDLAGWIRTAWMPFTNCVPESKRDDFINDFVNLYLQRFPLDSVGMTHVHMVRLEVDAHKA